MRKAEYADKERIIAMLSASFDDNQSVNYIIRQDKHRAGRIRALMDYSFETCRRFGEVWMSEDGKACALVLLPDKKRTGLFTVLRDLRLAVKSLGLSNLKKAAAREAAIKKFHPAQPFYYLWFIGVEPDAQGAGIGSRLMGELLQRAAQTGRQVYLETSTLRNLPWYRKLGFEMYGSLNFGYELFLLRR